VDRMPFNAASSPFSSAVAPRAVSYPSARPCLIVSHDAQSGQPPIPSPLLSASMFSRPSALAAFGFRTASPPSSMYGFSPRPGTWPPLWSVGSEGISRPIGSVTLLMWRIMFRLIQPNTVFKAPLTALTALSNTPAIEFATDLNALTMPSLTSTALSQIAWNLRRSGSIALSRIHTHALCSALRRMPNALTMPSLTATTLSHTHWNPAMARSITLRRIQPHAAPRPERIAFHAATMKSLAVTAAFHSVLRYATYALKIGRMMRSHANFAAAWMAFHTVVTTFRNVSDRFHARMIAATSTAKYVITIPIGLASSTRFSAHCAIVRPFVATVDAIVAAVDAPFGTAWRMYRATIAPVMAILRAFASEFATVAFVLARKAVVDAHSAVVLPMIAVVKPITAVTMPLSFQPV